jgi:hypothetical protein
MSGTPERAKPGWVYILTIPSHPGIVKVGQTTWNPGWRAEQIGDRYGLIFEVAHEVYCPDCAIAENDAHKALKHHQVHDIREILDAPDLKGWTEFFSVSVEYAKAVVDAAAESTRLPLRINPEPYWKDAAPPGQIILPPPPAPILIPQTIDRPTATVAAATPIFATDAGPVFNNPSVHRDHFRAVTPSRRSSDYWSGRVKWLIVLASVIVATALWATLRREVSHAVPVAKKTIKTAQKVSHHHHHHRLHHGHRRLHRKPDSSGHRVEQDDGVNDLNGGLEY